MIDLRGKELNSMEIYFYMENKNLGAGGFWFQWKIGKLG